MNNQVYLDYNASSPLRKTARDAIIHILGIENAALNASSVHSFGREGRKIVEQARRNVAALIGADPNQVIFNSGATEGNNTTLHHFAENFPDEKIAVCATEHPSVLQVIKGTIIIPVETNGLISPKTLDRVLNGNKPVSLVSIQYANSETGAIQNVSELSKIVHKHGALLHCDATQAAGRIPINMAESGIDFLTLSAHKIGGPQGIGALALGSCGQTPTLLLGGGQEKSTRAGTENVAGIAGFGAAAKESREYLNHNKTLGTWRDAMEEKLAALCPNIIIHAKNAARLPNTSFFSIPGTQAQNLLMALDLEGIAVSNGSACSSGSIKPSAALKAMGCSENIAKSALRVSTGWATKESDIDAFLNAVEKIVKRIKK